MLAKKRYSIILEMLERDGTVHTAELVEALGVSSETVRKDLEEADKELKTGNGHTCTDIRELFGNHKLPSDFVEEEADRLIQERSRNEFEFNRRCRNVEIAKVRRLLA